MEKVIERTISIFGLMRTPEAAEGARDRLADYLKMIASAGETDPERLVVCTDCGMGREGMSRRHAYYKMVSLVRGTNVVRKELGAPEAECLAADPRYSFIRMA